MQETFHYLLMADHLMVQKALIASVRDTDLTSGQPKVLDYLLHHDGAIQKEIAIFCHIEPASLTVILNGMENKGYIHRMNTDSNRRSLHVYLTELGKKYANRLNLEFAEIEGKALAGFTEAEISQFNDFLSRVYENMATNPKKEGTNK